MTATPDDGARQGQPAPAPTVSSAPPRGRHRVPSHIGPARTSTVVLTLLFLALGALYLTVRPASGGTANSGGSVVEAPAPARTTAVAPTTPTDPPTTVSGSPSPSTLLPTPAPGGSPTS